MTKTITHLKQNWQESGNKLNIMNL